MPVPLRHLLAEHPSEVFLWDEGQSQPLCVPASAALFSITGERLFCLSVHRRKRFLVVSCLLLSVIEFLVITPVYACIFASPYGTTPYVVIFLHRGSFVYCPFFLVRFTGSVQWGFLFRDRSRSCLPPKGHCSEEVFSCQKDRDSARGVPFFFSVAKTLTRLISPLLLETWNVPW